MGQQLFTNNSWIFIDWNLVTVAFSENLIFHVEGFHLLEKELCRIVDFSYFIEIGSGA